MSRQDLTDITFVLDRSGSMASVKLPTIQSFNNFLQSQKHGDGAARMSLIQFDDRYEVNYTGRTLFWARQLNTRSYQPRGSTALLDAIGRSIVSTGARLAAMPEHERPGTVLFVTLTDGQENASREFTLERINHLIAEHQEKYSWQFIFLGANQDAIASAARLGIGANQALTFAHSPTGTMACMQALNGKLHHLRTARWRGDSQALCEFDEADRAEAAKWD